MHDSIVPVHVDERIRATLKKEERLNVIKRCMGLPLK